MVRRRSLRVRVTAFGMLTMLVVLAVGAFVTVRALSSALRSDLADQNDAVLETLAAAIEGGDDPATLLLPFGADGTEFAIFADDGALVNLSAVPLGDGGVVVGDILVSEVSLDLIDAQGGVGDEVVIDPIGESVVIAPDGSIDFAAAIEADVIYPDDLWFRTSSTATTPDGETLQLDAYTPIGLLERSVDRLGWTMVVVVPIVSLLGGFFLWRSVGASLRPIGRISDEARRIAPSNSGDRLPVPDSGDEVAELTATLNDMLDRLDEGLIRQRQFVSDASHELRSPLTVVRGSAELLDATELDEMARGNVDRLQRGIDRLEAVLDDVTQLAEAGAGGDRVATDLGELVAAEVERWADVDDAPPIHVVAADVVTAVVTPVQVGRAVDNLVANAVRHAASRVTVTVTTSASWAEIIVDDDGPGVPTFDRERIFDRFVRLDDGRSRRDGGSGLGLALVASIAADHGGEVSCTDAPTGGARFVFRLPLATE